MKTIKQILRICGLAILILLACAGVGIVGGFVPGNREPYMHKRITIELVEKKDDESEDESEQKN